jgi:hypothetical protein
MRALDKFTRIYEDGRQRTARISGRWAIVLLAGVISNGFIGTSVSGTAPLAAVVSTPAAATPSPLSNAAPNQAAGTTDCRDQTWPYFTDACLRRKADGQAPRTARLIPIVAQADVPAATDLRKDDRAAAAKATERRSKRAHR